MNKIRYFIHYVVITIIFLVFTASAQAVCNVSTSPVTFGSYDVFSSSPIDAEGSISVSCNESPSPTVVVAVGTSANSGSFAPRKMKLSSGSDMLEYNLYIDTSRSQIWGDGTGSTFTQSNRVKKNRPETLPVYGRIPPLQDVSAGQYNETVTVTITW